MKTAQDIILWRHADAEPLQGGMDDLERALSEKGLKQAKRMAKWLNQRLRDDAIILCSPALRTQRTTDALGRIYTIERQMTPSASIQDVQAFVEHIFSSSGKHQILLVGHQPWLGQLAASLLGIGEAELAIKKGAIWWLRNSADEPNRFQLLTVMSPSLL